MNLKRWRKKRGLTQAQLAELCGVSRSLVMLIETRRLQAYPAIRKKIAEALQITEADVRWPR